MKSLFAAALPAMGMILSARRNGRIKVLPGQHLGLQIFIDVRGVRVLCRLMTPARDDGVGTVLIDGPISVRHLEVSGKRC